MDILMLGGDVRQLYAARELSKYYTVKTFGFCENEIYFCDKGREEKFDAVVLGLPCTKDGVNVNAPLCNEKIPLLSAADFLKQHGIIAAGMAKPCVKRLFSDCNVLLADYYDEIYTQENALPSAEGALSVGITAFGRVFMNSRVLILGYGRIGALLAKYLLMLGAEVTVAARSKAKRAEARANGCHAVAFENLCGELSCCDVVYNTVPAAVLGEEEIKAMPQNSVYIELASQSGIKSDVPQNLLPKIVPAGGLPAKTAPITAGEITARAVRRILCDELGDENERNI